jgi:hypothetical protein
LRLARRASTLNSLVCPIRGIKGEEQNKDKTINLRKIININECLFIIALLAGKVKD